ncbi:MAG TPA: thioredoxin [Erysipelothrix sp.]
MKSVTVDTFDKAIESGVVLVDFHAEWCGPCKMIAPILSDLAKEYEGKVKIVQVNVDEESSLAQRFDVMSIPTLILFKDGAIAGRKTGFIPKPKLVEFIESV